MSKTIILLSDGTGNAASNPYKTNVWRLYKALDTSPENNQIAFYDDGVGTSSFLPIRLLGLAFGLGLKRNVKELYAQLCSVYDHGDEIAIYGFSRGAFTARVLAALIADQGIIKKEKIGADFNKKIEQAYNNFRQESFDPSFLSYAWWLFRELIGARGKVNKSDFHAPPKEGSPLIKLLGVWDTVDAYGAPFDEVTRAWDKVVWPLEAKDRNLSPKIGAAFHALALDEQRESFEPTLWNEVANNGSINGGGEQILEQVWFAGVHSNVGGGYPDDSLAHISLNWMISKSEGIKFHPNIIASYEKAENANGPIYDNRSGMGNIYRYAPRKIEELSNSVKLGLRSSLKSKTGKGDVTKNDVTIECPKIHHTVFDRINGGGDQYSPIGIPAHYCVVDKTGNTVSLYIGPSKTTATTQEECEVRTEGQGVETARQAKNRRDLQAQIWEKVWAGKLLYLTTIIGALIYIFYPNLINILSEGSGKNFGAMADPFSGGLGDILRLVPQYVSKVPGLEILDGWAKGYQDYPYVFVYGLVAIVVALKAAKAIRKSILDEMRKNWAHISDDGKSLVEDTVKVSQFTKLFDSQLEYNNQKPNIRRSGADIVQGFFRRLSEAAAVLIFILALYLIAWKIFFTVLDGTGEVCQRGQFEQEVVGSKSIKFDSKNPCFDTGFELKKNQRYKLSFKIPENWSDATTKADVYGWVKPAPWYVYLTTPLKRHISKDWYTPIARVGNTWFERYSTSYQGKMTRKSAGQTLKKSFEFVSKSNDRLYLYLNDAVAPWPLDRWVFFRNNNGVADVTICEISKTTKCDT